MWKPDNNSFSETKHKKLHLIFICFKYFFNFQKNKDNWNNRMYSDFKPHIYITIYMLRTLYYWINYDLKIAKVNKFKSLYILYYENCDHK